MDRRRFLSMTSRGVAGAGMLGLVGCSGCGGSNGNVVKIVSSMPRTGSAKGQTDTIANAIRLAIDEYGGNVAGLTVEYHDWDDATAAAGQWTPELEKGNARKAISDPDVMACIGPYNSGAAMESMPMFNEAGLVQVSPACTWVGLTRTNPYNPDEPGKYQPTGQVTYCRVCPTDETQGPMGADYAKNHLNATSVYILDDAELYGKGVSALFETRCKALGVKILGHESINVTQQEFGALMTKIKGLNPGLLYFGGTTQSKGGQIAKDMKNVGLTCPLMVPDGCYEKAFIISAGAENLPNCYATMGGVDWPKLEGPGKEFVRKYQEKYGEPEAYAVYGYEAAKCILEAIKKVGKKDRGAILEAVRSTKDFDQGALGKWSFDGNGDISIQKLTIAKVIDGKFVPQLVEDKRA